MHSLFITATGTNVGKTHTTIKLIEALASKGLRVGVFKPIETGVKKTDAPLDASLLLSACQKTNAKFRTLTPKDITAYTFALPAAPFCADTQKSITIEDIIDKYHTLHALCDVLLVEGAGGLFVPILKDFMMIDLIKKLQIKTLLVTPSRLGCINDTLLCLEALSSHCIDFDWCVNLYEDHETFPHVSQPYYDTMHPQWWDVKSGLDLYIKNNFVSN